MEIRIEKETHSLEMAVDFADPVHQSAGAFADTGAELLFQHCSAHDMHMDRLPDCVDVLRVLRHSAWTFELCGLDPAALYAVPWLLYMLAILYYACSDIFMRIFFFNWRCCRRSS